MVWHTQLPAHPRRLLFHTLLSPRWVESNSGEGDASPQASYTTFLRACGMFPFLRRLLDLAPIDPKREGSLAELRARFESFAHQDPNTQLFAADREQTELFVASLHQDDFSKLLKLSNMAAEDGGYALPGADLVLEEDVGDGRSEPVALRAASWIALSSRAPAVATHSRSESEEIFYLAQVAQGESTVVTFDSLLKSASHVPIIAKQLQRQRFRARSSVTLAEGGDAGGGVEPSASDGSR